MFLRRSFFASAKFGPRLTIPDRNDAVVINLAGYADLIPRSDSLYSNCSYVATKINSVRSAPGVVNGQGEIAFEFLTDSD